MGFEPTSDTDSLLVIRPFPLTVGPVCRLSGCQPAYSRSATQSFLGVMLRLPVWIPEMGFSALSVRRRREQHRPGRPLPRQRCRCRLYLVSCLTSLPKTGRTPSCTCTVETCQPQVFIMTLSPVSRVSGGLFVRQDSNLRHPACGPALCQLSYGTSAPSHRIRQAEGVGFEPTRAVTPVPAFEAGSSPVRMPSMAEREGFEPPVPRGTSVFKTGAISQTLPSLHEIEIACRRDSVPVAGRCPSIYAFYPRLTPDQRPLYEVAPGGCPFHPDSTGSSLLQSRKLTPAQLSLAPSSCGVPTFLDTIKSCRGHRAISSGR